jgi:DNA helicase-2/ATP-dependent DNA helicase PcrA
MDEALILRDLNPAQRCAVTSPASVLQILAPPGSGKTKTLTARVAYLLLHHDYKPWNTLCLTFTIKSAKEMKERICKLIGPSLGYKLVLGTFHSVCRRYLVTYGYLIGVKKGFGIADSSDSLAIVTRIIKRMKFNIDPKVARSRISNSKARSMSLTDLLADPLSRKNVDKQEFIAVFEAYEEHLATSNLLDYDDLLLRCADLLREHPSCVSNVEAVLVDEFQDTNQVQFDLLKLFSVRHNRITTVGDPDQSIYGWRAAEIKNLRKMQAEYPDTLVMHLEDNYRSSGAILLAALEVIVQDKSRPPKPLLPTHCPGTTPVLRRLPTSAVEAAWVVSEIKRTIALTGNLLSFADYAVLLRSASLSRQIESAMGNTGIPYRMVGGARFYDRMEIKILLDYLRVISQPDNSDALARIVNVPARRIGDVAVRALFEEASSRKVTLWYLIHEIVRGQKAPQTKITKPAEQALATVIKLIENTRKKMQDPTDPYFPRQLLEHVIQTLEFKGYLERTKPDDHEGRWANVEELLAQASDCCEGVLDWSSEDPDDEDSLPNIEGLEQDSGNQAEDALTKFLANVALSTELQQEDDNAETGPRALVTISTIHAAKGLEWPVVFIPSAYEGSIPHSRAEDTDEERRLLYVAMTRAQAFLYISCPMRNSTREETTMSPFLSTKELAPYLTDHGPLLRFDATSDICQILRRSCPSEEELLQGLHSASNLEDNLWPLNGEEDPEVVAAKWAAGTGTYDRDMIGKRRKIGMTSLAISEDRYSSTSRQTDSRNSTSFKTTMEKVTTYSEVGGFVTAATQLQHMQEANAERTLQQAAKSKKRSLPKVGVGKNLSADPEEVGLMRYWGTSRNETQSDSRVSREPPILSGATPTELAPAPAPAPEPAIDMSCHSERCTAKYPKIAIPQPLMGHSLRPYKAAPRPNPLLPDEHQSTKAYVFLSSSPSPADTLTEVPTVPSESVSPCKEILKSRAYGPRPVTMSTNFCHSSSNHVTTVSDLQARNLGRKTLGVRRSMVGWSARGSQQLAKPRIAK